MIGSQIGLALPRMRAQAESLMADTVTITRPGATSTDSTTGAVSTVSAQVYSGKARWKAATTAPRGDDVASASISSTSVELHIPVGSCTVEAGDVVVVTASLDPLLVGRRGRVAAWWGGSQVTAYRLPIEAL